MAGMGEQGVEEAYRSLGLAPGATTEEVGRAYRALVRRYPPELNPERFARLRQAYEQLSSLGHNMDATASDPTTALEALFPLPQITLREPGPPPVPPHPEDLEPLLRPVRREVIERLLREAFANPAGR